MIPQDAINTHPLDMFPSTPGPSPPQPEPIQPKQRDRAVGPGPQARPVGPAAGLGRLVLPERLHTVAGHGEVGLAMDAGTEGVLDAAK